MHCIHAREDKCPSVPSIKLKIFSNRNKNNVRVKINIKSNKTNSLKLNEKQIKIIIGRVIKICNISFNNNFKSNISSKNPKSKQVELPKIKGKK